MKKLSHVMLIVAAVAWLAAPLAAADLQAQESSAALCSSVVTVEQPELLLDGVAPEDSPESVEQPPKLELSDGPEDCNEKVCGHGFFCCNFSCSICAPDGGFCTQQICE